MNIVQPLVRSLVSSVVSSVLGTTTRTIIDLNGVDAYYSLSEPWVAPGDFEIEAEFLTTDINSARNIVSSLSGDTYIQLFSTTSITVRFGGTWNQFTNLPPLDDGKLHVIKAASVGSNTLLNLDGIDYASKANGGATDSIDFVGSHTGTGQRFNGIIANVKLTDLTNPANSLEFKLGNATSNTETSLINAPTTTLTYNNISLDDREKYKKSPGQWDNISPEPQLLPPVLEIA